MTFTILIQEVYGSICCIYFRGKSRNEYSFNAWLLQSGYNRPHKVFKDTDETMIYGPLYVTSKLLQYVLIIIIYGRFSRISSLEISIWLSEYKDGNVNWKQLNYLNILNTNMLNNSTLSKWLNFHLGTSVFYFLLFTLLQRGSTFIK